MQKLDKKLYYIDIQLNNWFCKYWTLFYVRTPDLAGFFTCLGIISLYMNWKNKQTTQLSKYFIVLYMRILTKYTNHLPPLAYGRVSANTEI